MLEYIRCCGGLADHWGPLPATRLASRKILIQQNIKKRTGPALCVLCVHALPPPPPRQGLYRLGGGGGGVPGGGGGLGGA
jgi:hypothetical protein